MVVGISNLPAEVIQQFGQENGITFPLLRDTWSVYSQYYIPGGISPYPRDFIIDQNGIIQYANNEYDGATMELIVQQLLQNEECEPGNVNEDDNIDVLDIVNIVDWILEDTDLSVSQLCSGDADGNGQVDVLDIVIIVGWIMQN